MLPFLGGALKGLDKRVSDQDYPCRVCGAANGTRLVAGGFSYARCGTCHTLQKQMTQAEYLAMDPGYDPGAFLDDQSVEAVRAFLKVPMRTAFLQEMMQGHRLDPAKMAFLDVGCGMGAYMVAAKDLGMTALGFEPSANHGRVATQRLGLEVVSDYFSSDKVGDRKFDMVLLSHVIEHIHAPAAFIADLVSVLKPGGLLVIVTPNADSLSARLTGKHWPMLVPLDHVSMLTKASFAHLVPPGCTHVTSTSEFPSEFFGTLASIAKRIVKGRATNYADQAAAVAPKLMREISWRSAVVRFALAAASLPFHLLARATGRAAALRVVIRKPA
jgi:2-polyprenyl-3-methyl-5-hydroxy-6-metoxy-1,4-benzoquinol methylase